MKNLYLIIVLSFLVSCSGKRKLQKGNYDAALTQSINKLKSNPSHKKAKKVFYESYNIMVKQRIEEVNRLNQSSDIFKYEMIVQRLENLNYYYNQIQKCPSCLSLIPDPNEYYKDLENAKANAAEVRYNLGIKYLKENSIQSARMAYTHFEKALFYVNFYKDTEQKMNEALAKGTVDVIIEHIPMHSSRLALSNTFFENQIQEIAQRFNIKFVKFHSPENARYYKVEADHHIQMVFDDFVVGNVYFKEKQEDITKDIVDNTLKVNDTLKKDIHITAKATYTTFSKTVSSSGLLDLKIKDAKTNSSLYQKKQAGTFEWNSQWATYKGDLRVLSPEQLELTKRSEVFPPPAQDLFIEFTKPIASQVIANIQQYYTSNWSN